MVNLKMLLPTAGTATAFQETRTIRHNVQKIINQRFTLSGQLDHTEAGIIDEQWGWTFLVDGTGSAGQGTLSALQTMYQQTAVTGGSANFIQLVWVDPMLNVAKTATAFFVGMGEPQYLTPYTFLVDAFFRKVQ